jgi:threonine dehydratase
MGLLSQKRDESEKLIPRRKGLNVKAAEKDIRIRFNILPSLFGVMGAVHVHQMCEWSQQQTKRYVLIISGGNIAVNTMDHILIEELSKWGD